MTSLADRLAEALQEMVDSVDPEEGAEVWDLSLCAYYRKNQGLTYEGDGTCSFGCVDEPECLTCCPMDGWPLVKSRALLAEWEFRRSNVKFDRIGIACILIGICLTVWGMFVLGVHS